jgi:type II secretory pathway predicted ATPase ExeA
MFRQFFGMKFNPFDKELETGMFYPSADLRELNSRLKYLLENRGIFLLVGEPGSGKTSAIRKFADSLGTAIYKLCYFSLTTLTVADFYDALAFMLGEEPQYRKIDKFRQIQKSIMSLYYDQKILPVIIIDEIHMASTAVLDDLRMLFNFKMDSANPYVLILAGQPLIRNKLALNMCLPLKQRIGLKYSMQGLTQQETAEYLKTRMQLAGTVNEIFTPESALAIHTASQGFPRNINNLATHSLMYAAGAGKQMIDAEIVYQAGMELAL